MASFRINQPKKPKLAVFFLAELCALSSNQSFAGISDGTQQQLHVWLLSQDIFYLHERPCQTAENINFIQNWSRVTFRINVSAAAVF